MRIVLEYHVFYISVVASALIALLLLVRGLWGRKIRKVFCTIVWTVVLLRLIVPLGMVVPVSRLGCLRVAYEWLARVPFSKVVWIWMAGVLVTAAVFVARYVIWGRILREALPIRKVPDIDEEMFTFMGIRVFVSDRISSPVTFGIMRQKVLLPKYYMNLSREQLKYILIHEKIHIDRHDNFHKFLIICAVCIHWFNPFVWLMYVCGNRDIELACDERVIRQVGETGRAEYARVLISLASKDMIGEPAYSGFAGSAIRKRIIMIMGYQRAKKWNYALYAAAAFICALAFVIPGQTEASAGVHTANVTGVHTDSVKPRMGDDLEVRVYDTAETERVLKRDSSGARVHVTAKTREGVELNFKILLNKKTAVTNSGILTSYLPEGEGWKAGMDDTYSGRVTIPEVVVFEGEQYIVRKIGSYTFSECRKIKKIHIPDTVQEIEAKAFYGCESLKKLRLPSGLEVMGVNPFMGCSSLRAFEMAEGRTQYQVKDGILYTDFGRFLKVYPQGKKEQHVVIDKDVIQIATRAFYGAGMQSVTLPAGMIRVKSRAFQNCSQLTRVNAGSQTRFADDTFEGAQRAFVTRRDGS